MAEGHAEAERRPDQGQPRRPPDNTSLVGAVERMRAEVDSLARAVAASPEAVAARIDVDGAAAAVARRVDALGSALVQLRLSLLTSLERTEARLDEPAWLTSLQATLAELSNGARPGASASVAPDDLGKRLAALERHSGTVAADARLLVELVSPLPDRLAAVAAQIDRITPLARSADDADSLLGQLTQVSTGLEKILTHLAHDDRVQATVQKALERQEEAFAGRLERLDATIRALADQAEAAAPGPGPTLETVLKRLDRQERTMASRLEWVGDRLAEVAVHLVGVEEPTEEASDLTGLRSAVEERLDAVRHAVTSLSRRQEALTANVARLVAQIPPPPDPSASAIAARRLEVLRNERVSVQVRLQEERLLATQSWSTDPADPDDSDHFDSADHFDDLDDFEDDAPSSF